MPPPLPTRYRLEMRLGRDQDVEEWLATDTILDRPVLIRVVGPEVDSQHRQNFLEKVRQSARVRHIHLADVFGAAQANGFAYSVTEWTGGITLADRAAAGKTPTIPEFLSNAAGLADGLAALHEQGIIHGAIDTSAISHTGARPAKLGRFGREQVGQSEQADTQALARALEISLTGTEAGETAPSQVVYSLPTAVDDVLREAQAGEISAGLLAQRLRSISYTPPPTPLPSLSWRWVIPALVLATFAAGLLWVGSLLNTEPSSLPLEQMEPVIAAPEPPPTTIPSPAPPTSVPSALPSPQTPSPVSVQGVLVYDPLGDGVERNSQVGNLMDNDLATTWRTERYFDPLPLLKEGVGAAFALSGTPQEMELVGMTPGTEFQILWSDQIEDTPQDWELVAGGLSFQEDIFIQLPSRQGGFWLLWLIDLPGIEDGFLARIAEVRFR